ncbi:MAG: ABC transporter substrate-binding protein [Thermoplasmata archaeon]|jgi:branched-chain amino acid transport system substrate-binding protein
MGTPEATTPSGPTSSTGTPPPSGTGRRTLAIIVAVIIIVAAIGGGLYYYYSTQSSSSNDFVVGVVGPLTGSLGPAGTPWADGVTVWANAMNAQGGVLFHGKMTHVSVKMYDDQSNPSNAISLVTQAVSGDHVDMLVSGFLTPDTDAIASTIQQLQVPMIANAADDPEFHVGNPYLFSIYPLTAPEMLPYAQFFEGLSPQPFNISTLYSNEEAMITLLGATINWLGPSYHILYNQTYDPTALTTASADSYLLSANVHGLQALMVSDEYPGNVITWMTQMKALDIRPSLIFSEDMWDAPFFISQLGADANGMIGQDNWAADMTKAEATGDFANATYWFQQMNATYGQAIAINQLPYQGIMAAEVELAAIQKAGVTSGPAVAAAMSALNMATVEGRFQPNSNGLDPARAPFVIQIQNGEPVIIAPAKYATATAIYPLSSGWP